MATIAINDLDINQELDNSALQNIIGGRWVYRTYTRRTRRTYYRTYRRRYVTYRTYRKAYSRYTYQRYTRKYWV